MKLNIYAACMVAAGALAFGSVTESRAADLGGNCCSDLEERIAELEATTARKGNRKQTLTVYGQVNIALLSVDFEDFDYREIGDNSVSQTRLGVKGKAAIRKGWSAGYKLEIGAGVNRVRFVPGGSENDIWLRKANVWIGTPAGRITLGRANTSTYGIGEIDLSRADVAVKRLSIEPLSGRFLSDISPNDVPLDGTMRQIARYQSPDMAGFIFSASSDADDYWDVALRYAGEFGGLRLAAGVGHQNDSETIFGTEFSSKSTTGSVSVLHAQTGLFAGGSYGQFSGDIVFKFGGTPIFPLTDVDLKMYHVNGGVERKWWALGKTTLYGEFAELSIDGVDGKPQLWGVGVNQQISAAAMDVYLSYRSVDLDDTLGDVGKADIWMVGSRIRF